MSTEAMKRARDALGLYARTLAPTETQKKGMDAITALDKALAQPQQEPVAWVTVEKGVCATTRSANFSRIPDGQYQLYVGPLKNDVVAAITTLKALGYVYNKSKTCKEGEQWVAPQPAQRKPLTLWTETQHERAYRNSPELHKDVKSLAAFKRVAKEIAAMYGIKGDA